MLVLLGRPSVALVDMVGVLLSTNTLIVMNEYLITRL